MYIPLGGNRKGKLRTEINKLIVFALTGIWHGANWTFLVWGMIHGVANVLEDTVGKGIKIKNKVIKNIYVWLVATVAFVMFRADTVAEGFGMIKTMFTGFKFGINSVSYIAELLSPYYIFILILAVAFAYPVRENLLSYVDGRSVKAKYTINTAVYAFDHKKTCYNNPYNAHKTNAYLPLVLVYHF